MGSTYTPTEMMTIAAARALRNDDVCFVGIGLPSAACNLARLTHAPGITLIYESGTIGVAPSVLPLSIGDGELCDSATARLPGAGGAPEMADACREVFVVLPHARRAFVERLDFVTTFGHGAGG